MLHTSKHIAQNDQIHRSLNDLDLLLSFGCQWRIQHIVGGIGNIVSGFSMPNKIQGFALHLQTLRNTDGPNQEGNSNGN